MTLSVILGYTLITLSMIGIIGEAIYATVLINKNTLISVNDWSLQVFTPTIIFLFLFGLGSFISMSASGSDPALFTYLIPVMCAGSIFLSYFALMYSDILIYWKSD